MNDPFDRDRWNLPALALEFEDLVTGSARDGDSAPVIAWATAHLGGGRHPRDLCEAAMWVGLRHGRVEGSGIQAMVSHSVLGAHAASVVGSLCGLDGDVGRDAGTRRPPGSPRCSTAS